MKNLKDILQLSCQYLSDKGIAHPRRQAEEMLSHVLGLKRMQLYLEFERPISEQELVQCREVLKKRGEGVPLAYILGTLEFYHCSLKITPQVLIPRPETEILLSYLAKELKAKGAQNKTLVDLCTGSGCLALALKKAFPELKVIGTDISQEALNIAKKNASENGVDVLFLEGDFLKALNEKVDIIISNPPYISESEYKELDKEVRLYEPKLALVSGPTGLEFYEKLAREAPSYLNQEGTIWLEIGYQQGEAIKNLFSNQLWKGQKVEKDWSSHDRYFFCTKN